MVQKHEKTLILKLIHTNTSHMERLVNFQKHEENIQTPKRARPCRDLRQDPPLYAHALSC